MAEHADDAAAPAKRVLLFDAGGRVYGCDISAVREILPPRACTRLPGAPDFVCGLINVRGTVVTVLDLARRLGGAPSDGPDRSIVVVDLGARAAGLMVARVRDVQALREDQVEAALAEGPEGAPGAPGVVRGVARLDGELVVLLDVRAIVGHVLL